MFEFTSPRKLGSVNSNMNSGVLEAESVKFSPFSGELHLESSVIEQIPMGGYIISIFAQILGSL